VEYYKINVPNNIESPADLFSLYTETCYLGESGIDNWDWFEDSFYLRLKHSDIKIDVFHRGKLFLNQKDSEIYFSVMKDLMEEFPQKLNVDFSNL
jgi:hypothetical protein